MRSTAADLAALTATLALALPPAAVAASEQPPTPALVPGASPAVTMRLHSGLTRDQIRFIAQIGEPTLAPVAAGADATALAEEKCGAKIRSAYMDLVRTRNGALTLSPTGIVGTAGMLQLPACAFVEQNIDLTIAAETDLASLLTEATGYSGPNTVDDFKAANPTLVRGIRTSTPAAYKLNIGQVVRLPYRSRDTMIKLVPDPQMSTVRQVGHLKTLLSKAMYAGATPIGRLIRSADRGGFLRTEDDCPAAPNPFTSPWPFDMARFAKQFADAADASEALGIQAQDVRVGVLDSGFAPAPNAPFTTARLVRKPGPPAFDTYGLDAAGNQTPPWAYAGDADADHGTMVATLALGGADYLAAPEANRSRIKLRLGRVIDAQEAGAVYEGFLLAGLADARSHNAVIVNASLEFDVPLPLLRRALSQDGDTLLLVVAAGNDGRRPRNNPRFPANYGGENGALRDQILTVGSTDHYGAPAPFTARGSEYIDVLAPGCDVPTLKLDLTRETEQGTSLSAPLVTFLAAGAYQLGLASPRDLRQRAIVSSDPDAALYPEAFSAGVINPGKMIGLLSDQVHLTASDTPLRGRVYYDWEAGKAPVCKDGPGPADGDEIKKLGRLRNGNGDWLMMWRSRAGDLQRCRADVPGQIVNFTDDADGRTYPLDLLFVEDIIGFAIDGRKVQDLVGGQP